MYLYQHHPQTITHEDVISKQRNWVIYVIRLPYNSSLNQTDVKIHCSNHFNYHEFHFIPPVLEHTFIETLHSSLNLNAVVLS